MCVSCDVFAHRSHRSCVSVVMCLCAGVTDQADLWHNDQPEPAGF